MTLGVVKFPVILIGWPWTRSCILLSISVPLPLQW